MIRVLRLKFVPYYSLVPSAFTSVVVPDVWKRQIPALTVKIGNILSFYAHHLAFILVNDVDY